LMICVVVRYFDDLCRRFHRLKQRVIISLLCSGHQPSLSGRHIRNSRSRETHPVGHGGTYGYPGCRHCGVWRLASSGEYLQL